MLLFRKDLSIIEAGELPETAARNKMQQKKTTRIFIAEQAMMSSCFNSDCKIRELEMHVIFLGKH